jgi:iron complex transport system substrate-binding protein
MSSPLLSMLLGVFLLLIPLHPASVTESWGATGKGGLAVTDFRGKQLTFNKPVQRIVCLMESALSGLYMLDAGQQVVGVSSAVYDSSVFSWYAALDDRIRRKILPIPGNWDFVNIESVIALKPDVVVMWSKQSESIAALEEQGIKVFGVFIAGKEDVYREILALGTMTGKEQRAKELVDYSRQEISRFSRKVSSLPAIRRPGVYYMWPQGNLETSCGTSTVNDLITLAGGRNVCSLLPDEHLVVNLEQVLAWNPEMIVMWHNDRKDPEDIIDDPQWGLTRAVRNGQVYELPEVFLCDLWTLKFQFAVKLLAKWAHPELFRDLDMEKEQRQMLRKLYGQKMRGI